MARTSQTVPAKPFADWLNKRVCRYQNLDEMAASFGVATRTLHRYMACKVETKENNRHVTKDADEFNRNSVDEMLRNAGYWLWDVYDDLDEPVEDLKPSVILLAPELIAQAKMLCDEGASILGAAREIWQISGYASVETLARSLCREWQNQGWEAQYSTSQRYASGWLPDNRCEAWVYKRKDRCLKPARNGPFCNVHDPEVQERTLAHIRAARGEYEAALVDAGPFREWVTRAMEVHGARPLARMIDSSTAQLYRWKNGAYAVVRRESVERALERYGDGTTIDDLYSGVLREAV